MDGVDKETANPLVRLAKNKIARVIAAVGVGVAGTGVGVAAVNNQGANPEQNTPPAVKTPIEPMSSQQESPNKGEIDPNAVQITFDQFSKATIATDATDNGRILRIMPPPVSQQDALNRAQGFQIEIFWETLAGTPKPSRPFSYKITTQEGERIDGYVRYAARASIKQDETSPQPDTSPSVIDPKSLRVIFGDDFGSIIAIDPDGRLIRAIHLPSSTNQQSNPRVDVTVWRNTTGGKIFGDPVGANVNTENGENIQRPITRVPQLKIAA